MHYLKDDLMGLRVRWVFLMVAAALSWACTKPDQSLNPRVQALFDTYVVHESKKSSLEEPQKVFSKGLLALIQADQKATPAGEVGALSFDPLCVCQDNGDILSFDILSTEAGPTGYLVQLRFQSAEGGRPVFWSLVKEQGQWMVDDVSSDDFPSLRSLLDTSP